MSSPGQAVNYVSPPVGRLASLAARCFVTVIIR